MMRLLTIILCVFAMIACASDKEPAKQADDTLAKFFSETDTFLSANIEDGKVPYKAIRKEPATLNELVKMINNISLDDANPAEKKAFYINVYNILTINAIIKNNIPSSPMDVDGFFDSIKHDVAGKKLTLDEIEKGILFQEFEDARVHFAVVCAAKGCPQIRPSAYKPDKLDTQLNEAARESLNSDYFIRVKDKEVKISEIFKWYKKDFLKQTESVLAYINQFRENTIPADYPVDYYNYDWSLNSR